MKLKILMASILSISLFACTSKQEAEDAAKNSPSPVEAAAEQPEVHGVEIKDLALTNPLNQEWVTNGEKIYDSKCLSCHKLTDEKVVGPGWKGITQRRKPIWIMNMILNVEIMLDEDPEAQLLLEQCLIRMPNQNLTHDEARQVVEFMRHNDGEK
ncbi:MAG: cytochrome c [Bacteroidia bacterium]|jgi:cytochrome c5|nr:cytochrome c [Bacteroidota bacterium]MBP6512565.1 cytochrome c [Bacteroidia bacterium]MBP7244597.1 cytochrome c [Bacteroidia bacterium]